MTPATAFTKAVCERASKDGHGLTLTPAGYWWDKHDPVIPQDALYGHEGRYDLWAACCFLADKEYPDLQSVTID